MSGTSAMKKKKIGQTFNEQMSEISRYVLMNVAAVLFIQTSFSLAALLNCSNNSTNESDALLF